MKSHVMRIVIFNSQGKKREVKLTDGVNIITGESKTGKSALIEIIDYCLCSKRCTVPKEVITRFAKLYVLILSINEKTYIVARRKWEDGGDMFFGNVDNDFDMDSLELDYFRNKYFVACNLVQHEIESALGLFVTNTSTEINQKSKSASLRNMVSYLFQHQNLMASKFALFYRFNDYYKRKDVIEQFPVFAGMIGQEYYSDIIKLNSLKVKLNQELKKSKINAKNDEYIKNMICPLLRDYYALLDIKLDIPCKIRDIIAAAENLPLFDESMLINDENIVEVYSNLKQTIEDLQDQERDLLLKISDMKKYTSAGNSIDGILNDLRYQTDVSKPLTNKYTCPICGQNCSEIIEIDNDIKNSVEWLTNELDITKKYTKDFTEDIRKVEENLAFVRSEIRKTNSEIKSIKEKFLVSNRIKSKIEKIGYAKSKIEFYVDLVKNGAFNDVDEEIEKIKKQISILNEKIQGFDLDTKIRKAEAFLSDNMNLLAKTLDFENEFSPINLNFGLTDGSFDLYQQQDSDGKIYMYEMGSGANWISCHIALFLSFLHYFASQKNSPMLMTMFFDQPSQVYFPQGEFNEDSKNFSQSDMKAVNNMYQTMFDEIDRIGIECGYLPQLIIVDHVDGNKLDCKEEFDKHVRYNWRNGKALI